MRAPKTLSPEATLLLACLREGPEADRAVATGAMLHDEPDWASLLWMAYRHRLLPKVSWALKTACPERLSRPPLCQLRDLVQRNHERTRRIAQELLRLLKRLARHGISCVPFRDPVETTTEGTSFRRVERLHLLIHRQDVSQIIELLAAEGYQRAAQLHAECRANLFHPDQTFDLEMQWGTTTRRFAIPMDLKPWWGHLKPATCAGETVHTLAPEHRFLTLCFGGMENHWVNLGDLDEVAALLRELHLAWGELLDHARRGRYERILLLGCALAKELLGVALPPVVAQRVRADTLMPHLVRRVTSHMFLTGYRRPGIWDYAALWLMARERLGDRIRTAGHLAVVPRNAMVASIPLPFPWSLLYGLLQPLWLVGKHGLGFGSRQKARFVSYDPTPSAVIDEMLALAGVGPQDVVYDLGCGDGRIVIRAAQQYGVRAVGVDLDPARIAQAQANARAAGVEPLVRFVQQEIHAVDLSPATIVTLYLCHPLNQRLRPKLQKTLRPGARVVSRNFDMDGWAPTRTSVVVEGDDVYPIYLWRIPSPS